MIRVLFVALFTFLSFNLNLASAQDMKISSQEFQNNSSIPAKFTCDGQDINPALEIADIPKGTKGLALIVDDPDAPMGTWVHWVVYNIEPTSHIDENSSPGTEALNNSGKSAYHGPCPPQGTHRYFFKLYALDTKIQGKISGKADLEKAMQGHILSWAELVGLYKREH